MRAQAVKWRAAMINDLTASLSQIGYRQIYYQQALSFAEDALAGMTSEHQVGAEQGWTIVRGAFHASALNLIGSEKTLTRLTNYYDITSDDLSVISGASPPYRDMLRERIPWSLQKYIWEVDCQATAQNPTDGGYVFTLVPCAKPDLDEVILQTVEQLRNDPELQDKLRGRISQLKLLVDVLGRHKVQINDVLASLQSEGQ